VCLLLECLFFVFFFSSRRRHTRFSRDWSSDVCSSDLHRYLVTGLLARGGMSTVYRGMDTRLQRPVAIKVMHQQYAADRSWAQRFQREALATARLQHPNVVGVYDQGVDYRGDQAHAFLVMELVDGGTLRDLLDERGALPPALAVSITEQVLAGLAAAHRAGLVH